MNKQTCIFRKKEVTEIKEDDLIEQETELKKNKQRKEDINLHEENIVKYIKGKKRKNEHSEFINKRKKRNDDACNKCDGSPAVNKSDIKVPLVDSVTEFPKKNEDKCDIMSEFNDKISTESQNGDFNNLKIDSAVEDKKVESRVLASENKMAKSALKQKRAESRDRSVKSKERSTVNLNEYHYLPIRNSFHKYNLKNRRKSKPDLEKLKDSILKGHDWSSIFEINIPVIGKDVIPDTNDKPFTARYDLAILRNKKRFQQQKAEGVQIPNISYEECKKQQNNRTEEEKKIELAKKRKYDLALARCITRIAIKTLQHLRSNRIDEKLVGNLFVKFLRCPVTPTSLLLVPHFVHAMLLCRGQKKFSLQLRRIANCCYYKCHCMFPVPVGYNFETVYFSEVSKFLPDSIHMFDTSLDYGSFSESNSD